MKNKIQTPWENSDPLGAIVRNFERMAHRALPLETGCYDNLSKISGAIKLLGVYIQASKALDMSRHSGS